MLIQHTDICACCEGGRYIEAALEDLDKELKEKITPKGAKQKISKIPVVNVTEPVIDVAIEYFEDMLSDYIGLLIAETEGDKPIEEENELYSDFEDSEWIWYYEKYYYRNEDTDNEIHEEDKDTLSILFLEIVQSFMLNITSDLILNEISIQKWTHKQRDNIQKSLVAQYLLGSGGKNTILPSDLKSLKKFIQTQFKFLQKFAEEIKNGDLTGAKVLQRVGMYAEAITNGYEQAKAKSHGIVLPEYPADGNQRCHMNCRCRWILEDKKKYVLAIWALNPTAEHCSSCLNNSKKWNPLRVKKE